MNNEIWKDIKGYKGYYQISNLGKVKSMDRYAKVCGGGLRAVKGKILKPQIMTNGYLYYGLNRDGKVKNHSAHRLVAVHFIPNPNNKPEVNHIDENIKNNTVRNLEWVTSKENANHGTRNYKCNRAKEIKVVQLAMDGELIKIHDSCTKAGKSIGVNKECISRVCKGKQSHSKNYLFMYYKDYLNKITRTEVAM